MSRNKGIFTYQFDFHQTEKILLEKFFKLEYEVWQETEDISAEKARELYYKLDSLRGEWIGMEYALMKSYLTVIQVRDVTNFIDPYKQKISDLQEKLKKLFESSGSKVDRNKTIINLDSWFKTQKSLIEQIELIEHQNNLLPCAVKAEMLYNHITRLFDRFISNQLKIEENVHGFALNEQLNISKIILEKVISIQVKLKKIYT